MAHPVNTVVSSRKRRSSTPTWTELFQKIAPRYAGAVQGHNTEIQKYGPEYEKLESTDESAETSKNISAFNSNTDLGYTSLTSNHSLSYSESVGNMDAHSSSRNSITNGLSLNGEESTTSPTTAPKKTYLSDTTNLFDQLKEIRKEVENIKLELKINVAKKVDCDFLHVLLQGIPPEIKNGDIVEDLRSKQFSVDRVYRLKNSDNEATDEVVFELPKDEDHVFYFSCCLGFEVRVEEYKEDFSWVQNSSDLDDENKNASSQKAINILFRGIPMGLSESDILRDLREKRFHPIAVHSLVTTKRYLLGKTQHMVIVRVPAHEEHIYELACILGYPVTVEAFDKDLMYVPRCKNCDQFGHKTSQCTGKKPDSVGTITSRKPKASDNVPTINVVIKGVPIEFKDEIVLNNLFHNGFNPIAIHRMTVNEELLPTYLVQVPEREKRIYSFTCCLGFSVTVEVFLPDLYQIEQCSNCRQFGHSDVDCPDEEQLTVSSPHIENDVTTENFDTEKSNTKNYDDEINWIEMVAKENETKKDFPESTPIKVVSVSTQTEFLELVPFEQLDKFRVALEKLVKQEQEALKPCHCHERSKITSLDASTNTEYAENFDARMTRLTKNVNSYRNIADDFFKNMALSATALEAYNISEKISDIFEVYFKLKKVSGITSSFVDAMITTLKSATSIMMDFPNLPGITLHTINEQLHLLEELEDIKRTMDGSSWQLTDNYSTNFPELE